MGLKTIKFHRQLELTLSRLKTDWLAAMRTRLDDMVQRVRGHDDGVELGTVLWNESEDLWSLQTAISAINAAVDISGTAGSADDAMIDGNGLLCEPGALGTFLPLDTNAIAYVLGCLAIFVPSRSREITRNPGIYDYDEQEQLVGFQADPDSLTDSGGGVLKVIVDSVLDSAEGDCSAQTDTTIRVYLKALSDGGLIGPLGTSGWFEDLAIQWDGVNNFINTTTYLGQATPSTTASDYVVAALGPICRRVATTLPTGAAPFAFYTGAGSGAPVTSVIDWTNARENSKDIRCAAADGGTDFHDLTSRMGVLDGSRGYPTGLVYVNVADSQTVENTISATDFDKEFVIPADTLKPGSVIRMKAIAEIDNYNSGTLAISFAIAGEAFSMLNSTPAIGHIFYFEAELTIDDVGASGNYRMVYKRGKDAAAPNVEVRMHQGTLNTTAAQDCKATASWSIAHADNDVALKHISVEIGRVPNL